MIISLFALVARWSTAAVKAAVVLLRPVALCVAAVLA